MLKRIKIGLLVLLMAVLWLPLFQENQNFFYETKLTGAFVMPEKPEFSVDSFLSNNFQKKWEDYEDHNFGFRAPLIRIKNGLEYILFKEIDNGDIIEGKRGFLYSSGSARRTMRGDFYNGKESNENTISKIKFLKEGIEKHGGHFAVVIVPSKESVVPENLPSEYNNAVATNSDYKDFVRGYKKNNIPLIDLTAYFRKIRNTCPDQLFTKTGFHWSVYGASIAQDTILKYCQTFLPDPMPSYKRSGVECSDTARVADADFEDVMNLPFSLQQSKYIYPKLDMIPASLKNHRPKVIIIGDSFFWQIKNLKNLMNIFSEDSRYWYYFKSSFPLSDAAWNAIKDVNVVKELESADFVLLVGSMGTMGEFPFGVTDYYYEHITKPELFQNEKGVVKKLFYFKAANNKYVCADGARNNIVIADRDVAGSWETFSLLELGNNQCAISSSSNKFLSAELGHENEITATRDKVAGWETFTMVKLENNFVAFKAVNGKYLSLDKKSSQIFATGDSVGKNEQFVLINK